MRAVIAEERGALLVPQRALSELQGGYQLAIVDAANHAHIITVKTGEPVGSMMVVEGGLHAGDRVVVDGVQKVADGALVNPIPFPGADAAK